MPRPQGVLFVIPLHPRRLVLPGLLLAGITALLLCQRSSTAYAPIPADPPPELRLVFPDAFAFQRLNLSALADRELFKVVLGTMASTGVSEKDIFVREFGAPLAELDAIASIANEQNQVNIVSTRKAIESKTVLAAIAPNAKEQTYKGKIFYIGYPRGREEAFPFPGDKDFPRDFKDKKGGLDKDFSGEKKDRPIEKKDFPRDFKEKVVDFPREKDGRKEGDGPQAFQREKGGPDKDFFPGGEGPMRIDPWARAVYFLSDRTYVVGSARDVMVFIDTAVKPDEKHPLFEALSAAGKHHFAASITLPEELGREMRWEMRREMRRGPFAEMTYHNMSPLLAVKKAAITVDIGEESRLETLLTFPDARAAGKAQDSARFFLQMLKGSVNYLESEIGKVLGGEDKLANTKLAGLVDRFKESCADATVKADGTTLKVGVKVKTDSDSIKAVMTELMPRIELAARRAQSSNNLKQLALAMHMYHDSMGMMPPVATQIDRQGKPSGLSWRVHLLPYIEQQPLYRQFRLDEPWDSDNNKKLIPLMPKTFAAPGKKTKEEGMTFYQAFTTPIDENLRSAFPLIPNARMRIFQIPDGTTNTFAFVEAAKPVIWTKPDDILVDFKEKILPTVGGVFEDGFHASLCDGSVRFLRKKEVTEELLKSAITTNGGEITNWPGTADEDEDMPRRFKGKSGYKDGGKWEKKESRPVEKKDDFPRVKKEIPSEKEDPFPDSPPKDDIKRVDKFEKPVDKFTDKK